MELNWLPDHEAVTEIARPIGPHLSVAEAKRELRRSLGLVPAAIDPHDQTIIWADVGQNDLQEWQFLFSLAAIAERAGGSLPTIRTDLRSLPSLEAAIGDVVPPAGFIFHMSRCGSTLLGNVLNRSPDHLALNQPGPLQDGFWTVLTKNWREFPVRIDDGHDQRLLFQHLIRAILRKRTPEPVRGFVKFRSWSVLFLDFIQAAFPAVPCLFLYRDPNEVVASVLQKRNVAQFATDAQKSFLAGCDQDRVSAMTEIEFMKQCYANYLHCALSSLSKNMKHLNYRHLVPSNLEAILRDGFQIEGGADDIDLMKQEFRHYSKDRGDAKSSFDAERDKRAKKKKIEQKHCVDSQSALWTNYIGLETAPNNLFTAAP